MTLQEAQSVTREQLRTRAEIEFNKARENFWAFLVAVNPEMITGRWPRDVTRHLQKFYKYLGCWQTSEAGEVSIAAASDPAKRLRLSQSTSVPDRVQLWSRASRSKAFVCISAFASATPSFNLVAPHCCRRRQRGNKVESPRELLYSFD